MSSQQKENLSKNLEDATWLDSGSVEYLEALYQEYLAQGKGETRGLDNALSSLASTADAAESAHPATKAYFLELMKNTHRPQVASNQSTASALGKEQEALNALKYAYQNYGHIEADLGLFFSEDKERRLSLAYHGLAESDEAKKRLQELRRVYCGSVGAEFMHLENESEVQWLKERLESRLNTSQSHDERLDAYNHLLQAKELEVYLGKRYLGQKRFSLEGCEALIPFANAFVMQNAQLGMREVVIGMAHRGRLNVMTNIMGMPISELSALFEGLQMGNVSGDVKYHLGYTLLKHTEHGDIYVVLEYNPSHLEAINAVAMGSVRARQDRMQAKSEDIQSLACALLVHGDASVAGQGVVSECLNLAYTECNTIGGAVHVVVNNQIGFTTSPKEGRSARYCTGIAKSIEAPVFHVNAQDVDAVIWAAKCAVEYRKEFKKDIFIDLIGHRLHGHNESDDALIANPLMYGKIRTLPKHPIETYQTRLLNEGVLSEAEIEKLRSMVQAVIAEGKSFAPRLDDVSHSWQFEHWKKYQKYDWKTPAKTQVPLDVLSCLQGKLQVLPEGFKMSRTVEKMHEKRVNMHKGAQPYDWGAAELLTYASLLDQGTSIRIVGQDVRRGTFSHRHAVYIDAESGSSYSVLDTIAHSSGSRFYCYNSALSEYAALGFEYGYAETNGENLVIWEAQFGDFANTAQVMIDQFVSAGWQKWKRLCGLVLLLPHGAEGQGPEHSSARVERFLQLCAEENFQVCNLTTPGQYFHMIRRQVLRPYRRPLVCFSPKSLLRHPLAVSDIASFSEGAFHLVFDDDSFDPRDCAKAEHLVLCSGKFYYEIRAQFEKEQVRHCPIVRIEQLYPFPYDALEAVLKRYKSLKTAIWCQEEPQNQGAWYMLRHRIEKLLRSKQSLSYVGRPMMSSPAEGGFGQFKVAQENILRDILANLQTKTKE